MSQRPVPREMESVRPLLKQHGLEKVASEPSTPQGERPHSRFLSVVDKQAKKSAAPVPTYAERLRQHMAPAPAPPRTVGSLWSRPAPPPSPPAVTLEAARQREDLSVRWLFEVHGIDRTDEQAFEREMRKGEVSFLDLLEKMEANEPFFRASRVVTDRDPRRAWVGVLDADIIRDEDEVVRAVFRQYGLASLEEPERRIPMSVDDLVDVGDRRPSVYTTEIWWDSVLERISKRVEVAQEEQEAKRSGSSGRRRAPRPAFGSRLGDGEAMARAASAAAVKFDTAGLCAGSSGGSAHSAVEASVWDLLFPTASAAPAESAAPDGGERPTSMFRPSARGLSDVMRMRKKRESQRVSAAFSMSPDALNAMKHDMPVPHLAPPHSEVALVTMPEPSPEPSPVANTAPSEPVAALSPMPPEPRVPVHYEVLERQHTEYLRPPEQRTNVISGAVLEPGPRGRTYRARPIEWFLENARGTTDEGGAGMGGSPTFSRFMSGFMMGAAMGGMIAVVGTAMAGSGRGKWKGLGARVISSGGVMGFVFGVGSLLR